MISKPIQAVLASKRHLNHPRYRDCIGHWLMNETGGLTAYDISGYKADGVLTSGPVWTGGLFGPAISFDGTNDAINVPDSAVFSLASAGFYSWSFWLKPSSFTEFAAFWGQEIDAANYLIFYSHTSASADWAVTAGIAVGWQTTSSSNLLIQRSTNSVMATNTWAHVVITYTGSAAQASRFNIYVNGRGVTGSGASVGTITDINPTTIRLGRDSVFAGELFTGNIDDVRYYNRVLSLAEIGSLYNDPFLEFRTPSRRRSWISSGGATPINAALSDAMSLADSLSGQYNFRAGLSENLEI